MGALHGNIKIKYHIRTVQKQQYLQMGSMIRKIDSKQKNN